MTDENNYIQRDLTTCGDEEEMKNDFQPEETDLHKVCAPFPTLAIYCRSCKNHEIPES